MLMPRLLIAELVLLTLCSGFVAPHPRHLSFRLIALQLPVGSTWSTHQDELSSRILLNKARECAYSDYSSPVEAQEFLTKILEIESGCVSGLIAGHELCDNIDDMADIVAHLRQKAERPSITTVNTTLAFLPVSLGIVAMMLVLASTLDYGQDAIPFTLEEWIWALKGGYLPTMVSHFVRNGGL